MEERAFENSDYLIFKYDFLMFLMSSSQESSISKYADPYLCQNTHKTQTVLQVIERNVLKKKYFETECS